MTHSIFWFYVSCLYFPARALYYSQLSYEEFKQAYLIKHGLIIDTPKQEVSEDKQ
jgi:hypothetical protein